MTLKHLSLAAVLCVTFTGAPALADSCDQPNLTGFDSVYCFSKVFLGEDTRLNQNYSALRAKLSSQDRNSLKTAQRNWIAKRDASCMSGPKTVNVDCALTMTRTRADFLAARLVECRSVGCASSKLGLY